MKKILTILLTVILVVSGCWGALTASAAGTTAFETRANWKSVNGGGTIIDTATHNDGHLGNNWDDKYTYGDGGTSMVLPFTNVHRAVFIKLEGLTSGTKYELSFKYYIPSTVASYDGAGQAILHAAVYNEGTVHSNGRLTINSKASENAVSFTSTTGEDANGAPIWQYGKVTFTQGATNLYFAISQVTTSDNAMYLDDIKVTEANAAALAQPNSTASPMDKDYSVNASWASYHPNQANQAAYPKVLNGTSGCTWKGSDDASVYPDGNAVKFAYPDVTLFTQATKIINLTVGKTYTISYKYMIPAGVNYGGTGYIFRRGLYPVNQGYASTSTYYPNDTGAYVAGKNITANTNGEWLTETMTFTATATEAMLGLSFRSAAATDVYYIADVQVAEHGAYSADMLFTKYAKSTTVDGSSELRGAWPSSTVYPGGQGNTSSYSFLISGAGTQFGASAMRLNGLAAGMKYRVSFKYYIGDGNAPSAGVPYILSANVVKSGAVLSALGLPTNNIISTSAANLLTTGGTDDAAVWKSAHVDFTAAEGDNFFIVSQRVGTEGAGRMIDEIEVTPLAVETFTESKAAVRLYLNQDEKIEENKKPGLRIYNKLDATWASALDLVEFGSVAIKASNLTTSQLSLNTAGAISGVSYKTIGGNTSLIWAKDSASTTFTAYLSGISAKNYGQDYVVRAYAKDINGNVYYGDQISICIYDVVKTIFDTTSTWNDDCTIAQDFIDAGNAAAELDDSVVTYDEWKAAQ